MRWLPIFLLLVAVAVVAAARMGSAGISAQASQPPSDAGMRLTGSNLTGVYGTGSNGTVSFLAINNVSSVSVAINATSASPGQPVLVNVTFYGTFGWGARDEINATSFYLASKLINVHYYGVEYANQTGMLYDQNNGDWQYFVNQTARPDQATLQDPYHEFRVQWTITPTAAVAGKSLKICGGYFATYMNATVDGGWNEAYSEISLSQARVVNGSVINIPSPACAVLRVQ